MVASCRRACEIGLSALAFTEHADFVEEVHGDLRPLDPAAYREEVERCRRLFPDLRIVTGIELGEPHWFPQDVERVLAAGQFDRVLGSVHCTAWAGRLLDASQMMKSLAPEEAPGFARAYLRETLALVESGQPFEVLAHLDYPKRYWPHERLPYRETDFEEEYRAVLRAAAARGVVLEVNTTRGMDPARGLCPGPVALGWWVELGGRALSFGSDAHDPDKVARGFSVAGELAMAAGFRPNDDPAGYWTLSRP